MTVNIGELIAERGMGEKIGFGGLGDVYRIRNTDYIIKIGKTYWSNEDKKLADLELKHEFDIAEALYWLNFPVPMPLELLGVRHPESNKFVPAVAYEFAQGKRFSQLSDSKKIQRATSLRDYHISAAKKVGFKPGDHLHDGNSLYDEENDEIHLLDFEAWEKPIWLEK